MENKIRISYEGSEIIIEGNKDGLEFLSEICQRLSKLSEAEASTPGNHYHILGEMGNAQRGSVPLVIIYNPEL